MREIPDWIDGFVEYTSESEPPESFRRWVAISCVAAALQRKCCIRWGSLTFYPNMYIVLVAPSGKARKGTAMSPGLEMLEDLNIHLAAESITREALIRELRTATTTVTGTDGTIEFHSSLTIYSPELVVFLGHNNPQLLSDLTDWYDCRRKWTYRTKTQGTDEIHGVWVNLIGATTPELLQSALPLDAIGGGLTSRMIFVYEENKGKIVPAPFMTEVQLAMRDKLLRDLDRISLIQGEFFVSEDFVEMWTDWYLRQEANPPFRDNRLSGYIERRPNHLMKLAMIMRASRGSGERQLLLERRDLDKALCVLTATEMKMPQVFAGIGKSSNADTLTKIMMFVAEKKSCSVNELQAAFYRDADARMLSLMIETLAQMKFLKVEVKTGGDRLLHHIPKGV